jgi:hypothetical protein
MSDGARLGSFGLFSKGNRLSSGDNPVQIAESNAVFPHPFPPTKTIRFESNSICTSSKQR